MFNILLPPHMRSLHCYQRLPLTDEPIPTHHNYPKCRIYRRFVLGVVRSVDLDQCIRTCLHRLGVTQSICSTLIILFALPLHSPSPQSFLEPCLHRFAFAKMPCSWIKQYMAFSGWLLSFRNRHFKKWEVSSVLELNDNPLFGCAADFFIHTYGRTFGYLQILAVTDKVAVNIHVQIFVWGNFYYFGEEIKMHDWWII